MSDDHTQAAEQEDSAEISSNSNRFWPPKLNLTSAVCIVIFASCLIVALGYWLYAHDTNHKYDIARPGRHDTNQVLSVEDDEADTTGPITAEATKQKLEYLRREVQGLNGLPSFSADELGDQNIQLTPPDQPSF
jgi:hypothetical protein